MKDFTSRSLSLFHFRFHGNLTGIVKWNQWRLTRSRNTMNNAMVILMITTVIFYVRKRYLAFMFTKCSIYFLKNHLTKYRLYRLFGTHLMRFFVLMPNMDIIFNNSDFINCFMFSFQKKIKVNLTCRMERVKKCNDDYKWVWITKDTTWITLYTKSETHHGFETALGLRN